MLTPLGRYAFVTVAERRVSISTEVIRFLSVCLRYIHCLRCRERLTLLVCL